MSDVITILTSDYSDAFDTKTALTGFFLWLLFGFLSNMVSCDFKRWINSTIWFRHFVGIIAFFLLFAVIDGSNKIPIGVLWLKTVFVYLLFLLMVKSKWYFSVPVFVLLVIDQSLRIHHDYLADKNKSDPELVTCNTWRQYLSYGIYALIIVGFITYGIRQYNLFGSHFSWIKLLFHYKCKSL